MKFHVLYISAAISLLTQSCQATALLGNVADISGERVDAATAGVHMDNQGITLNDDQGTSLLNKKRQQDPSPFAQNAINTLGPTLDHAMAAASNRKRLLGGGGHSRNMEARKKIEDLLDQLSGYSDRLEDDDNEPALINLVNDTRLLIHAVSNHQE